MIKNIVLGLLRVYMLLISPFLPKACRFYPSCSQYALEAVQRHGSVKGLWLTSKRLLKCHPFHPGGVEGVPES